MKILLALIFEINPLTWFGAISPNKKMEEKQQCSNRHQSFAVLAAHQCGVAGDEIKINSSENNNKIHKHAHSQHCTVYRLEERMC